jgi:serine protease inhibitor ecotin
MRTEKTKLKLTINCNRQQIHAKQETLLLSEWVITSYHRDKLSEKKGTLELLA